MSRQYWHKQTLQKPLYPDILWTRPQSKSTAGKLAIIGGHSQGFNAPGQAYRVALQTGVGEIQVLLPDGIKTYVKGLLPDADFLPSTPSGSFALKSLDGFIQATNWSDMALIAGDIGRNSETAILLEQFIEKYKNKLTITKDSVDYFTKTPKTLINRPETMIVLSLSQLQKLFISAASSIPITLSMSSIMLVDALYNFSNMHVATIVTSHNDMIFVASNGTVSTTPYTGSKIWRVETATKAAVFWLQNPDDVLQSTTSSLIFNIHENST